MKKIIILLSVFLFSLQLGAQHTEIEILYQQTIPARDGIKLSATIVKPLIITETLPVLFVLTPYIADRNIPLAVYYARHDYVVVTVDSRGRGNSEGVCTPFDTLDGRDGYDVCKWIIEQSWCNGKIGMYGGSYLGMVQWQTLKEKPPGLSSIVPAASVCPGIDFPNRNNIFYTYLAPYFAFINGKTSNTNSFTLKDYWSSFYKPFFRGDIAFYKMMEYAGIQGTPFDTWLQHPEYDEYWKKIIPFDDDYARFDIPILSITGYYDDDQHGTLHYYGQHLTNASEAVGEKHYLIIGPWDHGGTRLPKTQIGDLVFSDESVIDMSRIHLEWFDWTLKNKKKPLFLADKVMYYIMGEEKWAAASDINLSKKKKLKFYLAPQGNAKSIFSCGLLSTDLPTMAKSLQYRYNPLDVKWEEYDLEDGHLVNYALYKNREIFKEEGLIYCSDALPENMTIGGQIEVSLHLSANVKDCDMEILLYEMRDDGSLVFLTTDYLRARYRNSRDKEELLTPGKVEQFVFKNPYYFVRTIYKGSRIILIVRNLNSPHYQKNFQSGKSVSHETKEDAREGVFDLYHGKKYPSFLVLPIIE